MNGLYTCCVFLSLCDCLWLASQFLAAYELGRKGERVWGGAFPVAKSKAGSVVCGHRGHLFCPGSPESRRVPSKVLGNEH